MVRGGLGFRDLDDGSLTDPTIAALRHRVHITEDTAMTARSSPERKPARVTLTLTDGRQATHACENSKRDAEPVDPEAQVREKFHVMAAEMLTPDGCAAIEAAVDRSETWPSLSVLIEMLRLHGKG